jgi:hypothetical protein
MKENVIKDALYVDAIQSMTMSTTKVVDSINIWINKGSFSLEPL